MKILIIQPKLEQNITQLEYELRTNPTADAVLFPEGYLNENVEQACALAKYHNKILIGGYRRLNESPKDRAILIDRSGEVVLDRIKYSQTTFKSIEGLKIGHMLCDELVLQGVKNEDTSGIDVIVHPIGVGMFSEEQFDEWINEARKIAVAYKAMIIGASHADGSFRGSGVSIPIAYCFDPSGNAIFISKNDVRTRMLNSAAKTVSFVD
ncbi:hypothetical protein GZH47_25410 [Paenibacillus rhizovicinus]|uniref:CN hydrolase domain-containing protein n=1 Tax=Paenibacillus rhizovicinus TaxID=2704463 RepID=A0A6C0P659_9BACL|nr:hypothetical protein [Paenibacillus rhizovicinus]QHW33806.1 hypothetical protein GZH47_25410 [Paenibacillus rhizovicinus]